MQKRHFGPLETLVPVVGQGTWQMEKDDPAAAARALRRGVELGMTLRQVARLFDEHEISGAPVVNGAGHLVGISSLAGRAGLPQSAVYSASKAALTTYLQSIRVDLRPVGIAVSDVQAGFVRTPMTEGSSFPRPFEWEVDRAARYIVDKLDKRPAIVDFQFPLTAVTNLVRVMPRGIYDRLAPLVIRR